MSTVKEAFEAAKASTEAPEPKEEKTNNSEERLTKMEAEVLAAKEEARRYQTEALKLRQDLAENVRITQKMIEENSSKAEPEFSNDELVDLITNNPAQYHKYMEQRVAKEIDKRAKQYGEEFQKVQNQIGMEAKQTKLELAKIKLAEKYEDVEGEWDELVEFGDKYPTYTANVSDPKHLEAFYLMFKGTKGEQPKKRSSKVSADAILKKMAGGLNASVQSDGEGHKLTPEQKMVADRYKMSAEEYEKYNNPTFTFKDHKGGK